MPNGFRKPALSKNAKHSIVYRNDKEFCGWPFYCGLWKTADGDLVAGFKKIPNTYSSPAEIHHDRLTVQAGQALPHPLDRQRPELGPASQQAVFDLATTARRDRRAWAAEHYADEKPVDFLDRNVARDGGRGADPAWCRTAAPGCAISTDGGRTWRQADTPAARRAAVADRARLRRCMATRADGMHLLGLSDDGTRRLDEPAADLCQRPTARIGISFPSSRRKSRAARR